jgi:hypothetical protein
LDAWDDPSDEGPAYRSLVTVSTCGDVNGRLDSDIGGAGLAAAVSNDSNSPHWSSISACFDGLVPAKADLCSACVVNDSNPPHWSVAAVAVDIGCSEFWCGHEAYWFLVSRTVDVVLVVVLPLVEAGSRDRRSSKNDTVEAPGGVSLAACRGSW